MESSNNGSGSSEYSRAAVRDLKTDVAVLKQKCEDHGGAIASIIDASFANLESIRIVHRLAELANGFARLSFWLAVLALTLVAIGIMSHLRLW